MDLISHVPGVGPTASFTPGPNTSAPLNVAHTGMTNGVDPDTSSRNMAEIYNRLMLQVASVIVKSGLTVDNANWAQLGTAVQTIASGSVQSLGISGQTLSISGGNSVTLPDADNQTLGLSGQTLSISGGNSVTLPSSTPGGGYGGYAVTSGEFNEVSGLPASGAWLVPTIATAIAPHPSVANVWLLDRTRFTSTVFTAGTSTIVTISARLNTGVWVLVGPTPTVTSQGTVTIPPGSYIVQLAHVISGFPDPVGAGGVGE